ncbi:histidine kinase [Streptomyces kunmingensis]|uniref:histidine kinase n=1 Tax=Streptomyces kunmingensis TaxID=68225 RepID=A0ABU6CP95_9ACTN|nr:histidine kinase [Streptomyces kunmingensis]MEB3965735.1 histidine kinase [Streptomyces kunmingensis]
MSYVPPPSRSGIRALLSDQLKRLAGPSGVPTRPADLWERLSGALQRPTGPLPRPGRPSLLFDAVLAAAVGVTMAVYAADAPGGTHVVEVVNGVERVVSYTGSHRWIAWVVIAVVTSAALMLRRRCPLAVLWAVTATAGFFAQDAPSRLVIYQGVIAAYSAAAYSPYRAATLTSLPVAIAVFSNTGNTELPIIPDKYVALWVLIPLVFAANGLRTWRLRADTSRDRLTALERERAAELRRAAERERTRIAAELHDVVTHNVSMMTIQAGAARKVMDTAPDQAREALLAVEAGGRAALAELRHAMGLLTMTAEGTDPATTADLAPQPGLDRIPDLVSGVRDTGLDVTLTISGRPAPAPSGMSLAAYRVVQEALTNTVKHASGATATVTVDHTPDTLRIVVTDTGGTPTASSSTGNGHGLVGLRERLAVYGGTLHNGPRLDGGYRTEALIPLARTESS